MSETFDPSDIAAIIGAMRVFEQRCQEIGGLLAGKRHLSPHERAEVEAKYAVLKADLKAAAKYGTLSGAKVMTRAEQCFYGPAVRHAAVDLRAATNTNPITSNWSGCVFEAGSEMSYYLDRLEKATKPKA